MTIDSLQSVYAVANSYQSQASAGADFSVFMNAAEEKEESKPAKTKREIEAEKTAAEIKAFFKDIKNAGGALSYVVGSNLEKIQKLLDEKREALKKASGFYSEPPLSAEAKAEASKEIEKAVAEYAKELIKELEDKAKAEKVAKLSQTPLKELLIS